MNNEQAERAPERFQDSAPPSLRHWEPPQDTFSDDPGIRENVCLDMGWGRLILAHTFVDNERIAEALGEEKDAKRDIAFYLRDPHVVLALRPQEFFLDPSHTYRLWLNRHEGPYPQPPAFTIREVESERDAEAINAIYLSRHMMPVDAGFLLSNRKRGVIRHFVAEDNASGAILGTATGVDHVEAFRDPERGSSFWCLAVSPQAPHPRVGRALVEHVAAFYRARNRRHLDLSVMHNNAEAIALYEQLGFVRVPVFCIKRRNPFNEPLYTAAKESEELNPYAGIIVREAVRRGIRVDIEDAEHGYFALSHGGRRIACRESLSELTSAVAMSRCDDKRVTWAVLERAGLSVPRQQVAQSPEKNRAFLEAFGAVVVKPVRGEQGAGVSVDVRDPEELEAAVERAHRVDGEVLIEEFVRGEDLRLVVIDKQMVAAAVRRPARVVGTGKHAIRELIAKQSRRRAAATGGESTIPMDAETRRCVEREGHVLDDVLPESKTLPVRKTANLHTGGTIHDVTDRLHPALREAAEAAARALDIPVVGLDLIVPKVDCETHVIIEANERPGLANHEPQPTAQRFVDLLFPSTA